MTTLPRSLQSSIHAEVKRRLRGRPPVLTCETEADYRLPEPYSFPLLGEAAAVPVDCVGGRVYVTLRAAGGRPMEGDWHETPEKYRAWLTQEAVTEALLEQSALEELVYRHYRQQIAKLGKRAPVGEEAHHREALRRCQELALTGYVRVVSPERWLSFGELQACQPAPQVRCQPSLFVNLRRG